MRFDNVPLATTNWISVERAAELTGRSRDEISAAISQVRSNSIEIPKGSWISVVERGEIIEYFENKIDTSNGDDSACLLTLVAQSG